MSRAGGTRALRRRKVAARHRLVSRLGLIEAIDAGLHRVKIHLPYHESDHVLTLA